MTKMTKRIILTILIFILLYATGGVFYNVYYKEEPKEQVKKVDAIETYGYTLKSNASLLYKTEYNTMKETLKKDPVPDEDYALSVAKLFIIDLYSISNKINKYDIGGTDFVYPDALANYKENVEDTIYKYVEDNSNKDRIQELPEVATITADTPETIKYQINDQEYDAFKIKLSWTYIKDMGYDTEGEIILIKIDKKYYIVEKN